MQNQKEQMPENPQVSLLDNDVQLDNWDEGRFKLVKVLYIFSIVHCLL